MPEPDLQRPEVPEPEPPQGRFLKMPYDLRPPASDRIYGRMWNPDDARLFPPKAFGWGYTINLYWLAHPLRYLSARS